jgi:hypothetical protein
MNLKKALDATKTAIGIAGAGIALYLAVARYHPGPVNFEKHMTDEEKMVLMQLKDNDSAWVISQNNLERFKAISDMLKKISNMVGNATGDSEKNKELIVSARVMLAKAKDELDLLRFYDKKPLEYQIKTIETTLA